MREFFGFYRRSALCGYPSCELSLSLDPTIVPLTADAKPVRIIAREIRLWDPHNSRYGSFGIALAI